MFIGEYLAQLQEKAGLCCAVSSTSYTVTDPTIRQPGFHHTQLPTPLSDSQVSIIHSYRPYYPTSRFPSYTVTDPTIRQPGFHLPRHTWSLMNRFRTGQGPCRANLHKWGLVQSPSCDCGQRQTMNHIVDTCPLRHLKVDCTKHCSQVCYGN